MAEDSEDGAHVVRVYLQKRTLEEQVEWLIFQVSMLVAKVNRLERDTSAIVTALQSAENRLAVVERATPLSQPKKGPPPRRRPWDRGI